MTPVILVRNVLMYSLQVTLLVGAAAALAAALNDRVSRAGLLFWQALLITCLALPLCQSWRPSPAESSLTPTTASASLALDATVTGSDVAKPRAIWPLETIALLVLGAGIVLRLAWLGIGLWALSRLRRTSSAIPEDLEPFQSAKQRLSVDAQFYSSASASTPVTFGLRHPVVLLPESILALDVEKQKAIACHELLHVKRQDWIQQVLEECLRGVLWFHPAVWWLLDRIHLVREQVVDQAVIELTESRQHYVEALLAVAALPQKPRLFPATLFLKKSRLRRRVNELFKENTMSRSRLFLSLGASAGVALLSAAAGSRLFPLEARAAESQDPDYQTVPDYRTVHDSQEWIEVKSPGLQLVHTGRVEYPRAALKKGVEGVVQIEVSVDEQGVVSDARVLDGPMELRSAALSSALRWHFARPGGSSGSAIATITFKLPPEGALEMKTFEYQGNTVSALVPMRLSTDDGKVGEKQRAEVEILQKKLKESRLGAQDEAALKNQLVETKKMLERNKLERDVAGEEPVGFAYDTEKRQLLENQMADRQKVEQQMKERIDVERQMKERMEQLRNPQLVPEEAATIKRQVEELNAMMIRNRDAAEKLRLYSILVEGAQKERLSGKLVQIRSERVSDDVLKELMSRIALSIGDNVDSEAMARVVEAVKAFDQHFRVSFQRGAEGGVVLVILAP